MVNLNRFEVSNDSREVHLEVEKASCDLSEYIDIKEKTEMHLRSTFSQLASPVPLYGVSQIEVYRLFLEKEKVLYSALNCFKEREAFFSGYIWCPKSETERLVKSVSDSNQSITGAGDTLLNLIHVENYPKGLKPPTLLKTTNITWVFQVKVNPVYLNM
jgi:vacuolar-type H+-ATPase subunit I/STV1